MKEEWKNGLEEYYVIRNNRKMRFGYTTGSCAAAAAKGAVRMLLQEEALESVELMTPKGILLHLELREVERRKDEVVCAVKKDAGDDPDTTQGILIYARVKKTSDGRIRVDGGEGIGRVTKPGLSQKPGEAAINPVPKAMIEKEARDLCSQYAYEGGLFIEIFAPEGVEIGKKTFNPRLGIQGGISILGTTGIVEPMSEKALIDSIQVEMKCHLAEGEEYLLITPGNYGEEYIREHLALPFEKNIKCSNYIGETIDLAVSLGAKGILFVSHIGKFVKVAGGIMNTHSHCADGRMEILSAAAIHAGADLPCVKRILACMTTEEALGILAEQGLMQKTMEHLMEKIQFYLDHRSYERILLGAVVFSNVYGYLGETKTVRELTDRIGSSSRIGEQKIADQERGQRKI